MTLLSTALCSATTHVVLLGSGELGREVAIECRRLDVEVIAVGRYAGTPTIHITHHPHIANMLNGNVLYRAVELEEPRYVVPEIEAVVTDVLIQLREEGLNVAPCVCATELTMNREDTRHLVAEELQPPTSAHRFIDSENLSRETVTTVGYPCIAKPVMSSSGKGQTLIRSAGRLAHAWEYAWQGGHVGAGRIIVKGIVEFDFEITLLAVSAVDDVHFCAPVGHRQEGGDYRESRQPQQMGPLAFECAQETACKVVPALGGCGLFGVEPFTCSGEVISGEVSSRPYDAGMMTLIFQDLSELALHAHAFLGLPVGGIRQYDSATPTIILSRLTSQSVMSDNIQNVVDADLQIRLFDKPEVDSSRRLEVALATAESVVDTIERTKHTAGQVKM